MLKFILKGIFRDRSRYLFPVLIIALGVLLCTFMLSFMKGYTSSMIRQNARFDTGHVKIVTNAYAELINQKPYDLGFLDIEDDLEAWENEYDKLNWVQRISFGALVDKANGGEEGSKQGQVAGFAVDLFSSDLERQNLRLDDVLMQGRLPQAPGEILFADRAFKDMNLALGDSISLIGSTVYGSMAIGVMQVVGTVSFGYEYLDRGGLIADITDVQTYLDMEGGSSEILGYFRNGKYDNDKAIRLRNDFNAKYSSEDEYAPVMLALSDQGTLGYTLQMVDFTFMMMGLVFLVIMGIVLWNSGLMSGIRRYGEFGLRLAIGEEKSHLYKSLLLEALCIGLAGAVAGGIIGMIVMYPLSHYGWDLSHYSRSTTIVAEDVIRFELSPTIFMVAIIPGVLASILGSAMAGLVIFKRQTSQLSKELEQ